MTNKKRYEWIRRFPDAFCTFKTQSGKINLGFKLTPEQADALWFFWKEKGKKGGAMSIQPFPGMGVGNIGMYNPKEAKRLDKFLRRMNGSK